MRIYRDLHGCAYSHCWWDEILMYPEAWAVVALGAAVLALYLWA